MLVSDMASGLRINIRHATRTGSRNWPKEEVRRIEVRQKSDTSRFVEGRDPFGGSLASLPTESGAGCCGRDTEMARWRSGHRRDDQESRIDRTDGWMLWIYRRPKNRREENEDQIGKNKRRREEEGRREEEERWRAVEE